MPHSSSATHRSGRLSRDDLLTLRHAEGAGTAVAGWSGKAVPMDTFKWIVSSLLAALVLAIGWFLDGINAELRDMRKEVVGIRVEAAVATSRLEALIAELRRRDPR